MKKTEHAPQRWWICLALAAITLAVFSPLFHCDFLTFDDQIYVTENPYVRSGLNGNSLVWAFQTSTSGNWLPVTWISHMLDYQYYHMNAGGHHLTNVLIHTLNVVLLFLVLQRMTGTTWRSAIVSMLFAWHPAHVESVAWVAERKDVLCSFFGLLTLWAYLRYVRDLKSQVSSFKFYYTATLLFFALGLMAKSMIVTWPFLMLLLDYWPLDRWSRKSVPRLVLEKVPLLFLSAACCAVTFWAQRKTNAVAPISDIHLWHRISHALVSYLEYVGMLIFPRGLAIFYPYPQHEAVSLVFAGAATLILVSGLSIISLRRRPWLAVGWFWFVGTLVPVIGLVQVGDQALADRYTYLPSIGLFIVVVWAGAELAVRYPFVKLAAPAAGLALLALTCTQVHYWKNTRTLFERALRVTQDNYLALALLGSLHSADGDLDGAMKLYRESLSVKPTYFKGHFFLAHGLEQEGKLDEARAEYELALRLNPDYEPSHIFLGVLLARQGLKDQAAGQYEAVLKSNPRSATAHNDLAKLLQTEGRLDESARHYLAALEYDSSLAQAHNNLGLLYLQQGRLADAVAQLREALRLNPGDAETEYNLAVALNQHREWKDSSDILRRLAPAQPKNANTLYQYGVALAGLGKTREAMSQFAQAILLAPDFADALDALAWIAATDPHPKLRNGGQAVAMASHACDLTGRQQPTMLLTLAAAYAEMGRFGEAMDAATKGRDIARTKANSQAENTANRMLSDFARRQPFREPPDQDH